MKIDKFREKIREKFRDDTTIVLEEFQDSNKTTNVIAYLKGVTDSDQIVSIITKPLKESSTINSFDTIITSNIEEAIKQLYSGFVLLCTEDNKSLTCINCQKNLYRTTEEPDSERTLSGPKDGFVESLILNISLLRQKIPQDDMKFKFITVGDSIKTEIAISYLESTCDKELIDEAEKRLSEVKTDGIYDANYLIELIKDNKRTLLNTVGITERPDTVCAKLLEGGAAILINGCPTTLLIPYLFVENFKSNDDYYLNFYYSTFNRILRYIAFFITLFAPAIYISFVAFHHEMLPVYFALSITASSSNVPMSVIVECTLFTLLFELLREAGLRMPLKIGQALSIVGAIIIGQAAVEAKIVSAPVIIVISITAVCGFMNPRLNAPIIIIKILSIIAASFLGLYGVYFVFLIFIAHLFSLNSFNVQYTGNFFSLNPKKNADSLIRKPLDTIDKNRKVKR